MSIELKPCPFCGGEAEMIGDQYPYVGCQECNVNFSANHSYEFDEDDAASKWNARSAAGDSARAQGGHGAEAVGVVNFEGNASWFDGSPNAGSELYTQPQPAVSEAKIIIDRVVEELENGFVACERCGDQEDTATLDCMTDLKRLKALLSTPTTPQADGWVSQRHIQATGFSGWCWIVHKGKVREAYRDKKGAYRFHAGSSDCYMSECVTFVMPWHRPQPQVQGGE